jgi:aspartate aminotransferase-like enzyme
MKPFPKLFIPGPTFVPSHVMESLNTPQIGHRTQEFSELMIIIIKGIQKLLYTKNHVYLASHPATGLWEMGVRNSVRKGILHAVNGSFSSKWATVSKECGFETAVLEYEWGQGVQAEDVDKYLQTGKYDVFAMVHNETSTGVKSPLKPISNMLKSKYPDVIWQVDAVSSMAGSKIEVDKLYIDFILSSTQKAWGLPAGFSVCAVSDRMIELSKSISRKGYMLDISVYEKYYEKMQTPSTPSIPHMYGLKYILAKIQEEGLENRWQRHRDNAKFTRSWALGKGQSLFPEKGYESDTITCIQNDAEWDINYISDKLLEKGFRMDRGYGKLKGKAFRIAHMGNILRSDLKEYLNYFDEVLNG